MLTHARRIRPLRLALATALIAGTLSGSAMAADGDLADLTCRKAGGTPQELTMRKAGGDQQEYLNAATAGGEQSIIAIL
jgi:hypothetical protein